MKETYNQALNLCEKEFRHEELILNLISGSVLEKQISALEIKTVNSKDEAHILMSNLVGVDGKIREAVAFKIHELIYKQGIIDEFDDIKNFEILSQALIDIDSNVCRLVLDVITKFKPNNNFCTFFSQKLKQIINGVFEEIEKFTFRDKKYKINKQVFKLYWCLEALNEFYEYLEFEELKKIIIKSSGFKEYTIREKCMKILSKLANDAELEDIYKKLKSDENYYVRNS